MPFKELQFGLHVFQLKISHLKRKIKRSFVHVSTYHAKTKQKKTLKHSIQEKQVSKSGILENLKTGLNQRIHFDHNEYEPIIIRNI